MISPLDIIVQLRRHLIMEESNAPAEWNGMSNDKTTGSRATLLIERDKWAEELAALQHHQMKW